MRLRWVSVEKGAAKAPAGEPAADGGSKADKKKDKGDADRVTRQVPAGTSRCARRPMPAPTHARPARPACRRAPPALPRTLRRRAPTAGPCGRRRRRLWTSRSSSCARWQRARRVRARQPPAGPSPSEGAGERAAAGAAAGAGRGHGGRAAQAQAAGGGGVEDVPAGPRAQVRAGAPPRGRGPHARDGGQARARRRFCAGPGRLPQPLRAGPRGAPRDGWRARRGTWRDADFKAYNFAALGLPPAAGALHPLLKVRGAAPTPGARAAPDAARGAWCAPRCSQVGQARPGPPGARRYGRRYEKCSPTWASGRCPATRLWRAGTPLSHRRPPHAGPP